MASKKKTRSSSPRGPRGTKQQIDAVKRNAREAKKELKAEQKDSVGHLAEALGEINEGEAVAHLDMRVAFLERQVERLVARREEIDRGVQGELAVMRARIEDALEAVGATAGEQKEAWVSLERQLAGLIATAEQRGADATQALREELTEQLSEALAKVRRTDSRVKGQVKALEESVSERIRKVSESLVTEREDFEGLAEDLSANLNSALESLSEAESSVDERITTRLEAAEAATAENVAGTLEGFERRLDELKERVEWNRSSLGGELAQAVSDLGSQVEATRGLVEERLESAGAEQRAALEERLSEFESVREEAAADKASVEERLTRGRREMESRLEDLGKDVQQQLDETMAGIDARIEARQREMDGGMSEARADVRMEAHRLKELVDERTGAFTEALDSLRRDVAGRVKGAEDKAAAADARFESLLGAHQRQMTSEDAARNEGLKEVMEEVATLKVRTEELLGRVSSTEARRATERGSAQVAVEALSGRLESLEQRVREAVDQVASKQQTKLDVLSARLDRLGDLESSTEEKAGAVEYLSRQVGEMAERVDEMVAKVNAIGKFVTRPDKAPVPKGFLTVPPELEDRLKALEDRGSADVPGDVSERLASMERNVGALVARARSAEQPAGAEVARLEDLERAFVQLRAEVRSGPASSSDLTARLEHLERSIAAISATVASRQAHLDERLGRMESAPEPEVEASPTRPEPEPSVYRPPARDILPHRKRR